MSKNNIVRYPLGSHRRWIETLLLLVAPFLIVYILLCVILHDIGIGWIVDFCIALMLLVAPCCALVWNGLTSANEYLHIPWLSDIAENLAYGTAREDGIHFRKWLQRRFVTWRAIERLEYWPNRDGRISLRLFSQRAPVIFIPDSRSGEQAAGTVEYISWKLNQAWPGRSTFLICFENPGNKKPGFIGTVLPNLNARQKAFANALCMLLTLVLFYAYTAIRFAYDKLYWKAIVVGGLLLIMVGWVRFSRKSRTIPTETLGKLKNIRPETTRKRIG